MKLIVGLGNPGKQYEKTRHNIGFVILDALRDQYRQYQVNEWELSKKFNAHIAGCTKAGEKILFAKPTTFMNHSGEAVGLITHFYKLTHRDLIVVHDEKDLVLGDIRVETGRGDAGHNGIKSIIDHIGTKEFTRVRVGIGSENKRKMDDAAAFVLDRFGIFEKTTVKKIIEKSVDEIIKLLN